MRAIMAAAAFAAILAGPAAPATAQSGVVISLPDAYVKLIDPDAYAGQRSKAPRRMSPQIEYDADKLPIGTDTWWQQMDRERRGGRR
jgi:hypothetical protein